MSCPGGGVPLSCLGAGRGGGGAGGKGWGRAGARVGAGGTLSCLEVPPPPC